MAQQALSSEWQTYLGPSELCDCQDPRIQTQARALIQGAGNRKEAAQRIFYFVRDRILFGMDHCDVRASETLDKGFGFCITKTNLQVALLRASAIPARYHQVVLSKESLRGIIPALGLKLIPKRIWWHTWCECAISEKWISCDSFLDRPLHEALAKKGTVSLEQIPHIDWDGESDLNMMKHWVLEDRESHDSLDELFRKVQREVLPPKIIASLVFVICNRYTNSLRKKSIQ